MFPRRPVVRWTLSATTLMLALFIPLQQTNAADPPPRNDVVVRFAPGALEQGLTGRGRAPLTALRARSAALQSALRASRAMSVHRVFPDFRPEDVYGRNRLGEAVLLEDLSKFYILQLPPGVDAAATAKSLKAAAGVEYADRITNEGFQRMLTPNDPLFSKQWWLHNTGSNPCSFTYDGVTDINATQAWDVWTGTGQTVKVGIVDTGIQGDHPDLGGRVSSGTHAWHWREYSINDSNGHGTSCAGIVGATGNNEIGVAGINWGATLVPMQIFDWVCRYEESLNETVCEEDGATLDSLAEGLSWAATEGIPIISMSIGTGIGAAGSDVLRAACRNAFKQGTLITAAMGNNNYNSPFIPAVFPRATTAAPYVQQSTFAVGALFEGDRWDRALISGCPNNAGSTYGTWIDMAAPGGDGIATTDRNSGYWGCTPCSDDFGGTSAATPVVAGVASLLLSKYASHNLMGEDLEQIMIRTAVNYSTSGHDIYTGWGGVKADAALNYLAGKLVNHQQASSMTTVETASVTATFDQCPSTVGTLNGTYSATRYKLRKELTFTGSDFASAPTVWIRGAGTIGTNSASTHVYIDSDDGLGEVESGSLTTTGCAVTTYVYKVTISGTDHWYPATTANAKVAITAVGPPDTTPPSAPTYVSGQGGCYKNVVSWTNSGDDGTTGQATEYQIRRALSAITNETQWSAATYVGSGTPLGAGQSQSADDWVGQCSDRYYYAVKLKDNMGNWSSLGGSSFWAQTMCPGPEDPPCEDASMRAVPRETFEPTALDLAPGTPTMLRVPTLLKFAVPRGLRGQALLIDIVDVNGRIVRRIDAGIANEALVSASWDLNREDGRSASAGIYFMRARIGAETLAKRLTVLR